MANLAHAAVGVEVLVALQRFGLPDQRGCMVACSPHFQNELFFAHLLRQRVAARIEFRIIAHQEFSLHIDVRLDVFDGCASGKGSATKAKWTLVIGTPGRKISILCAHAESIPKNPTLREPAAKRAATSAAGASIIRGQHDAKRIIQLCIFVHGLLLC